MLTGGCAGCSLKDMLLQKRMDRQLRAARGELEVERPPPEVRAGLLLSCKAMALPVHTWLRGGGLLQQRDVRCDGDEVESSSCKLRSALLPPRQELCSTAGGDAHCGLLCRMGHLVQPSQQQAPPRARETLCLSLLQHLCTQASRLADSAASVKPLPSCASATRCRPTYNASCLSSLGSYSSAELLWSVAAACVTCCNMVSSAAAESWLCRWMGSRLRAAQTGDGDSMRRREENSVRVTNLSEDTREDDLRVSHSAAVDLWQAGSS